MHGYNVMFNNIRIRKIANSHDETSYIESVDDLKVHPHWLVNVKLQTWFQKKWLSVSKVCTFIFWQVFLFCMHAVNVNQFQNVTKEWFLSVVKIVSEMGKSIPQPNHEYLGNHHKCTREETSRIQERLLDPVQ